MTELIAKKLHDALGCTVYTELVPQGLDVPSISVGLEQMECASAHGGWTLCKAVFRLTVREIPPEAVAQAVEVVCDHDGRAYRAQEMRIDGDFFVTYTYRARVREEDAPAPMMQVMTQKTEV